MRYKVGWSANLIVAGTFFLGLSKAGLPSAFGQDAPARRPHAGMLRFPDVSDAKIAFVYANDIWLVPKEGGTAMPLASPPGQESFPRFSPDGKSIAFVGNYDGNTDLYTIGIEGGIPERVTHHPGSETLCDWTSTGPLLFFASGLGGLPRQTQLFTVPPTGGLPNQLPVPYGANGSISGDGKWLAYTPHSRDHRTWKRYRGGMATDIWLFHLDNHTSKKITDWEGTDSQPMWHGQTIYYLSDAGPEHRLNIWAYRVDSGERQQITHATDWDIKWPSIGPEAGPGEIVYQNGTDVYLLDLASGEAKPITISVPGDRPRIRPHRINAADNLATWNISATGKRAVFEARGDIWTVPASDGSARNLTRTSGAAERDPGWSPNGQWIAYLSDEPGEYELYLAQSDGKGEPRKLTSNGGVYRYSPTWSPDSEHIAFTDKSGRYFLYDVDSGKTHHFDTDPWSGQSRISWSPDSHWMAYTKGGDNRASSIWLYNVADNKTHQVTSGMFNDTWPTFDRKGDYLYFASNRDFTSPIYEDVGTTFVYANTDILLLVPLRNDVGSPFAPKSDEEVWGEKGENDEKGEKRAKGDRKENGEQGEKDGRDRGEDQDNAEDNADDKRSDSAEEKMTEPIVIELAGFEARALPIPIDKGNFSQLAVNHESELLYVRRPLQGVDGKPAVKIVNCLESESEKQGGSGKKKKKTKPEERTVLEEVGAFVISADGKKVLAAKNDSFAIVDAAADQEFSALAMDELPATIDPRAEWRQLFHESWRIQRDFFYDPNMHGVDWPRMRDHYAEMIEDCASREDVTFVIGELISELNVGHAYAREGGDLEATPNVSVGMLGADYELHDGAYRITKIYQGGPWDVDARGPLSQPGTDVTVGDYLLAVNGVAVDVGRDPWAAFQGLADRVVTLTVSKKGRMDESARDVVVKLLASDSDLRYRAWIEKNRQYVADKTDGRVGYIYVPDTGINGQNNLFRQFFGQVDRQALIIDERWNGGGQIPSRFIELLNRPATNYWAVRDGKDWEWPPDSHQGPKCMLINGLAGSGGDCFPYFFRQRNIGKLIGMRTWGGLVGISGNPTLIDGGNVTAPTFAFYELDGTWGVEGHGVDPDIEVIDDPALMADGADPQLDAAIKHLLSELERHPYNKPARPPYPNRSGMGLAEPDK